VVKSRSTYRGYSASELNTRASNTCNHSVNGSAIDCVLVDVYARVRNVLGASNGNVSELCKHNNVNKWSAFSPYLRSVTGSGQSGVIVHSKPTLCNIGDFAGYNHNAVAPSYYNANRITTLSVPSATGVTFYSWNSVYGLGWGNAQR
jgi:hypothetical protein